MTRTFPYITPAISERIIHLGMPITRCSVGTSVLSLIANVVLGIPVFMGVV
jgi:hypothetical protein